MTSVLESLAWSASGMDINLFMVGDWTEPPILKGFEGLTTPARTYSYELEDPDGSLDGRKLFEVDFHFNDQPVNLLSILTAQLTSALDSGSSVAWFGFEGSFNFGHLLTSDIANQIYGIAISNGTTHTTLDKSMIDCQLWREIVQSARNHLMART